MLKAEVCCKKTRTPIQSHKLSWQVRLRLSRLKMHITFALTIYFSRSFSSKPQVHVLQGMYKDVCRSITQNITRLKASSVLPRRQTAKLITGIHTTKYHAVNENEAMSVRTYIKWKLLNNICSTTLLIYKYIYSTIQHTFHKHLLCAKCYYRVWG